MLSGIMLIVYVAIFVLQIILLVSAIRKKKTSLWIFLFLIEIIPTIIAFILMRYFDNLPGSGFMPGFTYFGEVIASLGAIILYAIMLFISLCGLVITKIISKKKIVNII